MVRSAISIVFGLAIGVRFDNNLPLVYPIIWRILSVVASFAYSVYWRRLFNSVVKLGIKAPKNTALLKKSSAFTGR